MTATSQQLPSQELHALAVEHAMRTGACEATVLDVRDSNPASPAAYRAIGRLAAETSPGDIAATTPLHVWCNGGSVATNWRDLVSTDPSGLWSELELARMVAGTDTPPPTGDPYQDLVAVRDVLDTNLRPN